MEKIERLAAIMREAKALIQAINIESGDTGISVISANVYDNEIVPSIQLYSGFPKVTGRIPTNRKYVDCDGKGYWLDNVISNGVDFYEIDVEAKEGKHNASMAVSHKRAHK